MPDDETPKTDPIAADFNPTPEIHNVEREEAKLTGHRWRQRGHTVHCDSCDIPHGFTVDPDKHLTGIDANGYPVISTISVKEAVHIDGKKVKR